MFLPLKALLLWGTMVVAAVSPRSEGQGNEMRARWAADFFRVAKHDECDGIHWKQACSNFVGPLQGDCELARQHCRSRLKCKSGASTEEGKFALLHRLWKETMCKKAYESDRELRGRAGLGVEDDL